MGALNEEGDFRILHLVFFEEGIVVAAEDAVKVIRRLFDDLGDLEKGLRPRASMGAPWSGLICGPWETGQIGLRGGGL